MRIHGVIFHVKYRANCGRSLITRGMFLYTVKSDILRSIPLLSGLIFFPLHRNKVARYQLKIDLSAVPHKPY